MADLTQLRMTMCASTSAQHQPNGAGTFPRTRVQLHLRRVVPPRKVLFKFWTSAEQDCTARPVYKLGYAPPIRKFRFHFWSSFSTRTVPLIMILAARSADTPIILQPCLRCCTGLPPGTERREAPPRNGLLDIRASAERPGAFKIRKFSFFKGHLF
ncbi:hypothetical protein C8R43DRAFT_1121989 [Mycena crocata]|nr:hypothetical protein C8R43DRAFT_1121989 [Mycena crocata]